MALSAFDPRQATPPAKTRDLILPTLRRFGILAVPVLLVAGLGLNFLFDQYESSRFDVVASREAGYLRAVEVVVQQELDEVIADVDTLSAAIALHRWSENEASLKALAPLFRTYGRENNRYDQIRLLDMQGRERLRVNFKDGQAVFVPDDQLQDKSARPYVLAMNRLKASERYVSPLNLNVEQGRIERPLNPTIRFGAPVYSAAGTRTGSVVFNYRAQIIEKRLRAFAEVGNPVDSVLINGRGEVIMDRTQGLGEWLIRAQGETTRLEHLHPQWWAGIAHGASQGRLMVDGGLLLHQIIHPLSTDNTHHFDTIVSDEGDFQWTALRFVPDDALFASSFVASLPGRIALGAVFGVMAAIMLLTAWYVERDARGRRYRVALLEEREADLGALIDAAPSGILVVNEDGIIARANRELNQLFGYDEGELDGQRLEVLIPERLKDAHPGLRARYFAAPSPRKMAENTPEQSLVARHKSGREIPVAVNLNMFETAGTRRAIATVIDVSRRRMFEAQLESARDQAQAASAAKSAFLATMSHEIRTPLNAIVGLSYLMGQSELDRTQRRDVDAIQASSKALLNLINDVLDVSRIEAGELVIETRNFRLADILRDLASMFRAVAAEKQIALRIDAVPADIPRTLSADPSRLHQILVNLIGNAIKFTETGHVKLEVVRQGEAAPDGIRLRFIVTDTGIGIDPSRLEKLFDPFVQADSSTSRKFGGSGLGLSIVKHLVTLMGGAVECESQPGEGTRFCVELPFGIPEQNAPLGRGFPKDVGGVRLLLVGEQNNATLLDVARLSASFAWEVTRIDGGASAPPAVCERARAGYFDAVLLVGDDGIAPMCAATKDAGVALPVLAVTRKIDVPCTRLEPPVSGAALFNAVNALIVSRGGATDRLSVESTMPVGNLWLAGVRVLAVDDSELNLQVVERLLALQGARVTTCQGGEDALARVRESPQPFDAILMDLQMPGMDGIEAASRLAAASPDSCPPIIALSAGATKADVAEASAAGMCEYLTKPVDPQVLVRVLRRCIEAARGRVMVVATAEDAAVDEADEWPCIEGIDAAVSAELMLGDPEFFASVLESFAHGTEPVPRALRTAVDEKRWGDASRLVHKLRGQAANVGASALQSSAGVLETQLNEQRLHPAVLTGVIETLERLRESISAWLESRAVTCEDTNIE